MIKNNTILNIMKKAISITLTAIFSVVFIGAGGYLGYFLANRNAPMEAQSDDVIRDDQLEKYNLVKDKITSSVSSYDDLSSFDATALVGSDIKVNDIANYALYKVNEEHSDILSISYGSTVTMGIEQIIHGSFMKNNNKQYYIESISYSSMANPAMRMYNYDVKDESSIENIDLENNVTNVFETGSKTLDGKVCADYEASNVTINNNQNHLLTDDEVFAHYGRKITTPLIYIISADSTLTSTTVGNESFTTSFSKNSADSTYSLELALDPAKSTVDYRVQMCSTTDMDKDSDGNPIKPIFYNVGLRFTLDKNLNITDIESFETYRVKKMGWNDMSGHLRIKFKYETEATSIQKIPSLSESIDYSSVESTLGF